MVREGASQGKGPLPGLCRMLFPEAALGQKKQASGWLAGEDKPGHLD